MSLTLGDLVDCAQPAVQHLEFDVLAKVVGFALGCAGWLYIVYETFSGDAAAYAAKLQKQASRDAFNYIRLIVSIGWTIYPLGFAIAYIIPGNTIRPDGEGPPYNPLNVLYNLADLVNKGAFGLSKCNRRERVAAYRPASTEPWQWLVRGEGCHLTILCSASESTQRWKIVLSCRSSGQ